VFEFDQSGAANTGKTACLNCTKQRLFILSLNDVNNWGEKCRCSGTCIKGSSTL